MDLLTNTKEPPKIRVVVRKRPLNAKETKKNDQDVLEIQDAQSLIVKELKTKVDLTKFIEEHTFTFDNVFELDAQNHDIYQECVLPLVVEAFKGAKTTCFAYGQTGSGKTFTMMGTSDGSVPGLYLLAAYDVIELLQQYEDLEIYMSFYEIYCGKLYDLLNNKTEVQCREDAKHNVNIIGLTEKAIFQVEDIMTHISKGLQSRTSGQTGANAESSRSHAILQMQIKHYGKSYGKLSFIDLAGSERGADTMNTNKQTKMDGAEINKSLLALKECIRALDLEKKHLPFRGSKLTQVLKDSFTGNSKTTMIANVSPANSCCEHTLNTLRYADRVKELKKGNEAQAQGGGAQPMPQKQTKQDLMNKELMLARQSNNTKRVAINQDTMKPKELEKPPANFGKPQLKSGGATSIVQPQMRQEQQQQQQNSSTSFNNFMSALSNASQNANQNQPPQRRPQSSILDQNQSNTSFNQRPPQQQMPNVRQSQNVNGSFSQQQQQQQAQNQPAPKFGFNRQNSMNNQTATPQQNKGPLLKQAQQQQSFNNNQQQVNFHPQQQYGAQQSFTQGQNQGNPLQISKPTFANQRTAGNPPMKQNNFMSQQSPNFNQQQPQAQSNPASQRKFSVNNGNAGFQFQPQQQQQQQQQQNSSQPISLQQRRLLQQQQNKMQQQQQQEQVQQPQSKKKPIQKYEYYALGDAVPTYDELEQQYQTDPEKLCNDHETLIEQILEEEEELINGHRKHIDDLVDLVKGEMALLNEVDKPGSDVEQYVNNLDKLLLQKIDMMHKIRQNLIDFHTHLKTEESMSKLYQQHQNLNGMDNMMDDVQEGGGEDLLLNDDDHDMNQYDQMDQLDQMDQMDQLDQQMDQMNYMDDEQQDYYNEGDDAY